MAFDGRVISNIAILAAINEGGSLVCAAEALGMTRSGVSRALSRLEALVGVRLFDRTTKVVALTDEGRLPRPTKSRAGPMAPMGLFAATGADTGAINWYPRFGIVSMKSEFFGRSPSALRKARMCLFTACGSVSRRRQRHWFRVSNRNGTNTFIDDPAVERVTPREMAFNVLHSP
jgi:hypothetical protein